MENDLVSVCHGLLQGLAELNALSIDRPSDSDTQSPNLAVSATLTSKHGYLVIHLPERWLTDPEHFIECHKTRQYLAHKIGKRLLILRVHGGIVALRVYLQDKDAFQVPQAMARASFRFRQVVGFAPRLATA